MPFLRIPETPPSYPVGTPLPGCPRTVEDAGPYIPSTDTDCRAGGLPPPHEFPTAPPARRRGDTQGGRLCSKRPLASASLVHFLPKQEMNAPGRDRKCDLCKCIDKTHCVPGDRHGGCNRLAMTRIFGGVCRIRQDTAVRCPDLLCLHIAGVFGIMKI